MRNQSSVGSLTVREGIHLFGNLLTCEVVFSLSWWLLNVVVTQRFAEALEDLFVTSICYVPIAFAIGYVPIRVLALWARPVLRPFRLLLDPWSTGALLGVSLALASTYTRLLWLLSPLAAWVFG